MDPIEEILARYEGQRLPPEVIRMKVLSDIFKGIQAVQDQYPDNPEMVEEMLNSLTHTGAAVTGITNLMSRSPYWREGVKAAYGNIYDPESGEPAGEYNAPDSWASINMPWSLGHEDYRTLAETFAHEFMAHPSQPKRGMFSALWNRSGVYPHGIYEPEVLNAKRESVKKDLGNQRMPSFTPEEVEARALAAHAVDQAFPHLRGTRRFQTWPEAYDKRYKILFEELMAGRR